MPSLASSAISAAISEYRALTCHTRWTRRRGLDSCGTRVHTIPEPLATSIAAARAITSAGSSDTSTGSPVSSRPPVPAGSLPFFLAIAGPTFPVGADTVRLPAGRRRGKAESDRRARSDNTQPARPSRRQTNHRARGPKKETATRAAHAQPCRTSHAGRPQDQRTGRRWTSARPARHAGPARRGHGDAGSTLANPAAAAPHPPAARTAAATPEACFVATSRHQDPETNHKRQVLLCGAGAAELELVAPAAAFAGICSPDWCR